MLLFAAMPAQAPGADAVLEECIFRIAQGEREALETLYQQTRSSVYGFALSILKNPQDAEDVLHDTYLQVWNGASGYRSQGKAMAWLLSIVRNLAMDCFRRQSRMEPVEQPELEVQLSRLPEITQEDRLTLAALLDMLDSQERQVITLHALTGLKHREIAHLLHLPLSTVLSKYSRGIKKLKLAWKEAE